MSSNFTENYQLNQWEAGDKVQRVDFNADNAKIDGALAQKANVSALNALEQRVDGKADASALNALSQTVAGHTTALAGKGNCQIWTTTYTGTGAVGESSPTRIRFPSVPLIAFVVSTYGSFLILIPGQTQGWSQQSSGSTLTVSWSGATVSFYHHSNSSAQMNAPDTYRVIALMSAG